MYAQMRDVPCRDFRGGHLRATHTNYPIDKNSDVSSQEDDLGEWVSIYNFPLSLGVVLRHSDDVKVRFANNLALRKGKSTVIALEETRSVLIKRDHDSRKL